MCVEKPKRKKACSSNKLRHSTMKLKVWGSRSLAWQPTLEIKSVICTLKSHALRKSMPRMSQVCKQVMLKRKHKWNKTLKEELQNRLHNMSKSCKSSEIRKIRNASNFVENFKPELMSYLGKLKTKNRTWERLGNVEKRNFWRRLQH